jgi:hypothetical protein
MQNQLAAGLLVPCAAITSFNALPCGFGHVWRMSSTNSDDRAPAARAVPDELRIRREALRLVQPINEKLSYWQGEAARVMAARQRLRESGRHDPGVLEALRSQCDYMKAQAKLFDETLADVAREVATHSRVIDTQRALAMVVRRLEESLQSR